MVSILFILQMMKTRKMKKQSSIDFLVQKLAENGILHSSDIHEAKELHKKEIIKARETAPNSITEYIGEAEDYYNWTYKNTKHETK